MSIELKTTYAEARRVIVNGVDVGVIQRSTLSDKWIATIRYGSCVCLSSHGDTEHDAIANTIRDGREALKHSASVIDEIELALAEPAAV